MKQKLQDLYTNFIELMELFFEIGMRFSFLILICFALRAFVRFLIS